VAISISTNVNPRWLACLVAKLLAAFTLSFLRYRCCCQFPVVSAVQIWMEPAGISKTARNPASGATLLAK
jgi:hypothetical protein